MRRKITSLALIFALCVTLCACGGKTSVRDSLSQSGERDVAAQEETVTVHARVPENWGTPGCWVWCSDGRDAFEAWPGETMTESGDWYTVEVPAWVDYVIINGNGGAVQTVDCQIESGRDIWVSVNGSGDAKITYEEPVAMSPEEMLAAVEAGAGQNWITDIKAITAVYEERDGEVLSQNVYLDYLPGEAVATAPEEVCYIVNLYYRNVLHNLYIGNVSVYNSTISVEIVDMESGKTVRQNTFRGKGLPDHIVTNEPAYFESFEDESVVLEWTVAALNEAREEKYAEAMEIVAALVGRGYSYVEMEEVLSSYYELSPVQIRYALENCGADWYQEAVICAQNWLSRGDGYSPQMLVENLRDISRFTEEQAVYGMENCGADWNQEALKMAKYFLEIHMGYSHSSMILVLVNDYGFTEDQAQYAADNCGADWNAVAVDHVRLFLEYSDEPYTRARMIQEMVDYYGFTEAQAVYACDVVGLK